MNWSRSDTKTSFESLMGDKANAEIKWFYAEDDELAMVSSGCNANPFVVAFYVGNCGRCHAVNNAVKCHKRNLGICPDEDLASITYSGAMNWSRSDTKASYETLMGDTSKPGFIPFSTK